MTKEEEEEEVTIKGSVRNRRKQALHILRHCE